ncbi:gephyrin-like molybdotransferase Glp [Sulfurimonas sp. HSL1-6]|uniref:molybdopterin molybdotransferase MoeA n=1 Tax=Thiomicrolovo immobilis TaxID=3131935 RepID=UPI0031F961D4
MPVTVEEALARIHAHRPKLRREFIPIEEAIGRVLAQDVTARYNLPPFDNSAMDGYAVISSDSGKRVLAEHTIFAGDREQIRIAEGQAARIMTGARIPEGTECIVPIEEVTVEGEHVTLPSPLRAGQHIRLCGEDIQTDDTLLTTGDTLSAYHITLLASQGITHVCVYHRPRVAIFASGSELKMHHEQVAPYQLYNTNSPTFAARAAELECDVHFVGTAADTLDALLEHIDSALQSDLIITSGGVSVGDADYTKEAFTHFSFIPLFEKVDLKPGKPTTVGTIGDTLVLNLPGNPMAAALCFELFGQALIASLSGTNAPFHNSITARMKHAYNVRPGRRTLLPGYYDGNHFTVCEKFAPGMITPLALSNGFIMLDEACSAVAQEAEVRFIPTRFVWRSGSAVSLVSTPEA